MHRITAAIGKKSALISLAPFIHKGVLRVRGRLANANLNYDQKHPMILPKRSLLTTRIIERAHIDVKHSGELSTLRRIREKFYIPRGRQTIKGNIRKCVRCHRFKAKMQNQIMADLPFHRVQSNFPFTHTGVDYAGLFQLKTSNLKNASTTKAFSYA